MMRYTDGIPGYYSASAFRDSPAIRALLSLALPIACRRAFAVGRPRTRRDSTSIGKA